MAETGSLNGPQRQHLLSSCQYADKLLSEVEAILDASQSKSVFPKYNGGLTLAQARLVEDYIGRIRSQILRALESQGIAPPQPALRTLHSVRVTLTFASVAFEECTAQKMRGYGEVPAHIAPELNGLVNEIKAMLDRLHGYLGEDPARDPAERLRRLDRTGEEVELLRKLAADIAQHGLVDYRARLSVILDRMESNSFEIAVFGRVSCGKSSLLNRVAGVEILPVGVNPVTAVPSRIAYGPKPRLLVATAGEALRELDLARVREFVTEQENPANRKRVERLVVEYPSDRLRDGVVLVDTPGLGSLACAGAAETMAYLPRCDLGVVLIDAGSTLTAEDLSTVQALHEAAIQTAVVLSKADLLAGEDVGRVKEYVNQQIRSHLGLELPIHAVSVQPGFTDLLDRWFAEELAPLYERHRELTQESLRRKIGALRDAVAASLRARRDGAARAGPEFADAETRLRRAAGRFEEVREACFRETHEIRQYARTFLQEAARSVMPVTWKGLAELASTAAAAKAGPIRTRLEALAGELAATLRDVAELLDEESPHEDLAAIVKEMPRIDLGSGELQLRSPWIAAISQGLAHRRLERQLEEAAGERIEEAFATFGSLLESWCRRVCGEIEVRFNNYADAYRARLAEHVDDEHN
ncbi:MAG TPA: dynamin family protein [Bryobacteraceae bacterium]|nr:dynamin family protein [Bryobacteraceae bacterium]